MQITDIREHGIERELMILLAHRKCFFDEKSIETTLTQNLFNLDKMIIMKRSISKGKQSNLEDLGRDVLIRFV